MLVFPIFHDPELLERCIADEQEPNREEQDSSFLPPQEQFPNLLQNVQQRNQDQNSLPRFLGLNWKGTKKQQRLYKFSKLPWEMASIACDIFKPAL
jgi:hypothetical protein